MDANELLDPFTRLLEDVCAPAAVRAVEAGGPSGAIWDAIAESGFLDALVAEEAGGAGLTLAEVAPLLQALGRHAVPVPVAETMIARALLAEAGVATPAGPIVLAPVAGVPVPLARAADHALIETGDALLLAPIAALAPEPIGAHADLAARLAWSTCPEGVALPLPAGGLMPIAAILRACAIAGAADRLLTMTVAYANERVQFGKPIGRQQAIQQQLAVMAEKTIAVRIAAALGCAGGLPPRLAAAATAKQVTSAAAAEIAATAHAVHGAIGISEEYDLQLYTRRLHEWRLADGAESYWARRLGAERLAAAETPTVAFVRTALG